MAAAVVAAAGRVCAFGVVRAAWRGAEVGVGRPAPSRGGLTCVRLWEAELPAGGRLRNRHGDGAALVVRAAVWGEPGCSHRYS